MKRFLVPFLALLAFVAPAFAQTRALPPGEIRSNGDITFGNALKLGKREGGTTFLLPDAVQSTAVAPVASPPTVDLRSEGKIPDTFMGVSGDGSVYSFCPWTGCDVNRDINRAQAYIRGKTKRDVLAAETLMALDTYVNTGYVVLWKAGTAYALNGLVSANGNVYRATTGGTSAASGTGPSGTGTNIADGTVRWSYVQNANDTDAKTTLNITTAVGPNAGHTWVGAVNMISLPGVKSQTTHLMEWDMSNYAGDCTPILRNCFKHFNYVNGPYTNSAYIYNSAAGGVTPLSAGNASGGAMFDGIVFDSPNAIRNSTIVDGTNSKVTLKGSLGSTKAQGFISDQTNGQFSYQMAGAYSFAGINDSAVAPYGYYAQGTYSTGAYRYRNLLIGDFTGDTSYTALTLNQTFGADMIGLFGKSGDPNAYHSTQGGGGHHFRAGGATLATIDATQWYPRVRSNLTAGAVMPFGTPASATAACIQGQMQVDASYIYTCIATNSWRRTSVGSTF